MKRKPRYGEKWAAISGIALAVFLFWPDWFSGASGWDSLGWFALGACVVAALAGVACAAVFMLYESPVLPIGAAITATFLGIVTVVALLVQVWQQPGPDEAVTVMSGWWLGLLAAAGVARGGFLSMRDEYLPGVPMPDVEVRPAPVA